MSRAISFWFHRCVCGLDIEINHKHGKVVKLATADFQSSLFSQVFNSQKSFLGDEHCCMQLYIMGDVVTRFCQIQQGSSKQQLICHCGIHAHLVLAGSASKRILDGPPNIQMATASASSSDSSLLRKIRWLWIGKDDAKLQTFLAHEEVNKLNGAITEIIKHPCPCFPKTMLDEESGQQRIQEVELGDVFAHEVWKRVITQPASVGALHSHRRAWHVAELKSATDWAMFIEDDIKPTANAFDRIKKVFEFFESDDAMGRKYHMVNFVTGDSPYMKDLAETYSVSVLKDGRLLEIRTCPMKPSKSEWQLALHVGLGLKWYALSGTARRFLLMQSMQVEAYELFIMGSLVTSKVFQNSSSVSNQHLPDRRVVFITPTCGEHARDYEDFFIGSGRYEGDSGHEAGPYVFVKIPPKLDLIPRLHMV